MNNFQERIDLFLKGIVIDLETELVRVAPVDKGYLKNSINVKLNGTVIEIYMPEYALFVEFGSRPHIIRPKNAKALHWKASGTGPKGGKLQNDVFAKIVQHPGTQPNPFIRNTFYHKLPAIVKINAERYIPEIADQVEVSV